MPDGTDSTEILSQEIIRLRAEVQRQRDQLLSSDGERDVLRANVGDNKTAINTLAAKVEVLSRPNYQALGLYISIVILVFPAIWLFVTTYTGSEIGKNVTPIASSTALNSEAIKILNTDVEVLKQNSANSSAADVASRTDRVQINDRLRIAESGLSKEIADRRSFESSTLAKQIEIETQFCEQGHIINLMHANELRIIAILWHKTTGDVYPTDNAYYPIVCHQNANGSISTRD